MLIIESQSMDVYRNLAIEEYLMDHVVDQGPVLFLWQSDCAVVMGKNQNPWRECRLDLMRNDEVPMARRISGGGTVYHDSGNLNYCVIVDRRAYREQEAYDLVLSALESFGIHAERSGKSNLSVDGFKFSGNAFCFRKGRALHHGTLLLQTDLERLSLYLGAMFDGIDTHAIASVPAQVMNLSLDVKELSSALMDRFRCMHGMDTVVHWNEDDLDAGILETYIERQHSDEWKYGATPRFQWADGDSNIDVFRGRVIDGQGPVFNAIRGKYFSEVAFSLVC